MSLREEFNESTANYGAIKGPANGVKSSSARIRSTEDRSDYSNNSSDNDEIENHPLVHTVRHTHSFFTLIKHIKFIKTIKLKIDDVCDSNNH